MKTFVTLGALGLALMLATPEARAQAATKIGWIDLQRTLMETKVGKQAKDKLEAEKNTKQKEVNESKDKLQKQAEELNKQRVVMKPDALQKRERELQEEYVQLQQKFMTLQQDLAKREAALTRDIFERASSIIQDIAARDGYSMIIEKNEGAVLWASAALDITAEVNKRLDAGEGKPAAAPAAPKKTDGKK